MTFSYPEQDFSDSITLTHSHNTWNTIIDTIEQATQSIHIGAFLWRDDNLGNTIAEKLLHAAERGVRVTIEKDIGGLFHEWAEQPHQSFFHTTGPVPAYLYTLLQRPRFIRQKQDNLSRTSLLQHENITFIPAEKSFIDHSKVLIIDDIVILGGMNIGDEYNEKWFDMMTHIRSYDFSQKVLGLLQQSTIESFTIEKNTNIQVLRDIPIDMQQVPYFKREILDMISQAQEEITILGGYFCDKQIADALIKKLRDDSEIQARIIVSAVPNMQKVNMQDLLKYIDTELPDRIEVIFSSRMIHAKSVVIDDKILIGSANFDSISGVLTGEFDIRISGNTIIIATFKSYIEELMIDALTQEQLSGLFWERKFKDLIESFLQRFILSQSIILPSTKKVG